MLLRNYLIIFRHFTLKLSQIRFLSKKNPATSSPLSHQSLAPRSEALHQLQLSLAPPITGETQVVFCVFRLDFSFSFRFSSSLTFLWLFLGSISTPCWKNSSKFQVLFLMNHNFYTFDFLSFFMWVFSLLI